MTFAPDLSGTSMGPTGGGAPKKQMPAEMAAVREYCMGQDGRNKAESTVLLHVSHSNLKETFFQEIRLDMHMTVERVKHKLEFHVGTSAVSNQLYLLDENKQVLAEMEDSKMLGYYSPYDGCTLHIVDLDPHSMSAGGWLEDTSLVKKYEISEEAYAQRENTYRNFKAKKLAEDPNWTYQKDLAERAARNPEAAARAGMMPVGEAKPKVEDDDHLAEEAKGMSVGDRCEAAGGRRGTVRWVGRAAELPKGWWVGVQYDEPVGKNDGSVKGARYFDCPENYGGFLRPDLVSVGDFPEEDPFADLGGEETEI
eukprot:CAMPEP_0174928184 /NCGR_PEP_ID=MMETSP1355-20121228/22777_1 /TAXON_ID=464990 /ORGANISM="Hemiselmis tepida, Strain CCMP443" /LENGTH=309 /DNA_ID=CAMNT_0016174329 /DNA_START=43 /DNA_END=972 /DNA_ORIENTATION=-